MTSRAFRNARILIVDDEDANIEILQRILTRAGFARIETTNDSREVSALYIEHRPDLILLDLHLPDISGKDVLRDLRADPRTATTPVVILSADATTDQPQRLIARGATDYLTKPFNIPRILHMIDHLELTPPPQTPVATAQMTEIDAARDCTRPAPATIDPERAVDDGDGGMAIFAHDLINLLGVILTYTDLLEDSQTQQLKVSYLQQLGTTAEKAIEMTRGLLPT